MTIREIARIAGVGVGTVSRALNGNGYVDAEKKKHILEVAEKYDYNLPKKRQKIVKHSGMVGVIIPDVSLPFFGKFLQQTEKELLAKGYRTVVINSMGIHGRVMEAIEMVKQHALDGLIINADVTSAEIELLKQIPVVSFECELGDSIPLVTSDHVKGGKIAAKILFQCGCKNVVILSAKANTPVYARHRIEVCQRLLKKNGVHVSIVESVGEQTSSYKVGEMINEFMNSHTNMDGIFTEDMEAYWCLAQAKKRGIVVPRDFKIVGYDGNDITKMISPQVTTIIQNVSQLAGTCVEVLHKRIQGQKTESLYLIPVKLSRGGTTE